MEIEAGKRYVRRDYLVSGIMEHRSGYIYSFIDPDRLIKYTKSGQVRLGGWNSGDLIHAVPDGSCAPGGENSAPPEATKHDSGKPRYDLLPGDALDQIAQVFTFGATKYADRNWEGGMAWGRLFAALMRHCWAFWRGEDNDPETGYHHLAHAGACILMLLASVTRGAGTDDRGESSGR